MLVKLYCQHAHFERGSAAMAAILHSVTDRLRTVTLEYSRIIIALLPNTLAR
jgi:hypothetical protein